MSKRYEVYKKPDTTPFSSDTISSTSFQITFPSNSSTTTDDVYLIKYIDDDECEATMDEFKVLKRAPACTCDDLRVGSSPDAIAASGGSAVVTWGFVGSCTSVLVTPSVPTEEATWCHVTTGDGVFNISADTYPYSADVTDRSAIVTPLLGKSRVPCTSGEFTVTQSAPTPPTPTCDETTMAKYGWTAQSPTIAYDYTGASLVAYTDGFSSLPTWDGNPSWAHHPFIVQGQPGNPLIFNSFDTNPGPDSRTETAKFTTSEGCEFTTTITQTAPPCGHFTYEFIGDKQQTDTLDLTWDGSTGTTGYTSDHYVITGTCYDCSGNYVEPVVSNSKSEYPYWKKTVTNTGGINYKIEIWFDGKYDRESVNNTFTIKNPNSTENMLTFTPTVTKPTIEINWYIDWRDQETAQTRTLFYFVTSVQRNVTPDVATGCNAKIYVNVRSDGSIPCTECTGYGPDEGWDNYCFSGYKEIAFAVNEQACSVRQVPWKCYTQQGYQTACYPATSYSAVSCEGWAETKEVETLAFKYLFRKG